MEELTPRVFRERTGIDLGTTIDLARIDRIVAPRALTKVEVMLRMSRQYLRRMLDGVTLEGANAHPYRGLQFSVETVGGGGLKRAQTFVEEQKLLSLVRAFGTLSSEFCGESGFAALAPYILLGRDGAGRFCLAHYLPPIVEEHHTAGRVLLDGTHRASLVVAVGNGMTALVIKNVTVPFPVTPVAADEVRLVAKKPTKREERFKNLNPCFFRDLKWIGVDG